MMSLLLHARARAAARLLTATLAIGASSLGCATIASHDDYAAYREVRAAREDARLLAMANYISRFPNGVWADQVRRERSEREQDVWSARNATREGLDFYLAAYPDGRYVEQARQRLAAVSVVQGRRGQEAEHVEQVQQERREQSAEERRHWVTTALQFWSRTLLGVRNYGSTIAQVARQNPEFSQAFGQRPEPLCTPQSCIKHYHGRYAIPVPGATRLEREMHMFLRILLNQGRVDRVEILLPQKGFSRWYELENRTLVTDEDPEQRQAAISWALERIEPVIREAFAGGNPTDVVPEPIAPISASAQAASAGAEESTEAAPTTSGSAGGEAEVSAVDRLLEQAAGVSSSSSTPAPPEAPVDTATLALPFGLRALQRGNVRVVAFAAADQDFAEAYDGIYVERIQP